MGTERFGGETGLATRLNLLAEGETEAVFAREILFPWLHQFEVVPVVRDFGGWGPTKRFARLQRFLTAWVREDRDPQARFTTMIDLYGLPHDFPGRQDCSQVTDSFLRADCLQKALQAALNEVRFVPYIQVHEFEALLFSDPERFSAVFPDSPGLGRRLTSVRADFQTPEHINDSPNTAPSKRIGELVAEYRKPAFASLVASWVGIEKMLQECPRFAAWVGQLQQPGCGIQ